MTLGYVESNLEQVCEVEVPEHLHGAWSDPYSVVITACSIVVLVASRPLSLGIVKKGSNVIMGKITKLPGTGEGSESSTTVNSNPLLTELSSKANKKAQEQVRDIESGLVDSLDCLKSEMQAKDSETSEMQAKDSQTSGAVKKFFNEPDHASAVFYNVVNLIMAMMAFVTYWTSEDVNFMKLSLISGNKSIECR